MLGVLLAKYCIFYWDSPVYSKTAVQNADSSISFGVIELVTFVLEYSSLTQYGKAVGEAFGDEELTFVLFTELYGYVLAVGGAAFADVYCYVKDGTTDATEEFALGEWGALEVEASHYSVGGHGFVILHKGYTVAYKRRNQRVKLALGETLKKVSPRIVEDFWLYY